jgi:hypothetical protein
MINNLTEANHDEQHQTNNSDKTRRIRVINTEESDTNSPATAFNYSEQPGSSDLDRTISIEIDRAEFVLAHQLAHALRTQDTDRFIFIYDHVIPDDFGQSRVSIFSI